MCIFTYTVCTFSALQGLIASCIGKVYTYDKSVQVNNATNDLK